MNVLEVAQPSNRSTILGVYAVTCRVTGKAYIGSSGDVHGRLSWHKSHLRNGKHSRRQMQADFIDHGEASFSFEVVCRCEDYTAALLEEARRIGEAFKAGLCYNGIVPNVGDVRPRAKASNMTKGRHVQAVDSRVHELKRQYEGVIERQKRQQESCREVTFDIMFYLGYRTEEQFLHLIDSFLKLTGGTEEALSLEVTGYPKFLFVIRQRASGELPLDKAKKFHDHILNYMEDRDREVMAEQLGARKAWIDALKAEQQTRKAAA